MAARGRPADGEARLDPVRWRVPHRGALVRVGLTAVLLLIAAGALYPGAGGAPAGSGSAAGDAAPAPGPRLSAPAGGGARRADAPGPAAAGPANAAGTANAPEGANAAGPANALEPADALEPANAAGVAGPPVGGRLPVPAGSVGVPVRVVEPATVAVVRPGDRIDLLAVAAGGRTSTVAADALVLAVAADGEPGAALYLALTRAQAQRAVAAPAHTRFAALVRP